MYFKGRNGWYNRTQYGGCYPVNNGDPQCDDPEFDEAEAEDAYENAIDSYLDERGY